MSAKTEQAQASNGKVQVGDRAPSFTAKTQGGATISLDDYLGKSVVVLYFYPKDQTGGCTAEACSFRDSYEVFKEAGAEVIGVSADSDASHQKFADKYHLPFMLVSDRWGKLRRLYGVPSILGLVSGRVTYVIDKEGIVRHTFSGLKNATDHVSEALKIIQSIA